MKTCHLSDLPAVSSWFAVPLYKGASLPSELEFLKEYLEGLSLEKGKNYHIVQTDPRYPRHILILGLAGPGLGILLHLAEIEGRHHVGDAERSARVS